MLWVMFRYSLYPATPHSVLLDRGPSGVGTQGYVLVNRRFSSMGLSDQVLEERGPALTQKEQQAAETLCAASLSY